MKLILCLAVLLHVYAVHGRILPYYVSLDACKRSDPIYEKCLSEKLESSLPYFMKGIPEVNFPALDPFNLPHFTVDNEVNELVRIKAHLKNVQILGMNNTIIQGIKADPKKMVGEIKMFFPFVHLEMEYDVSGQLVIVPLQNKGFFIGNFTDTTLHIKTSLDKVQRNDGEEYFKVKDITVASRVGDGIVKLISKNPSLQFAADIIANFYNENPRLVMDAINPIYVASSAELFKTSFDQILAKIPANELLPE